MTKLIKHSNGGRTAFGNAFATARGSGQKLFTWNNNQYNTRYANEVGGPSKPSPSVNNHNFTQDPIVQRPDAINPITPMSPIRSSRFLEQRYNTPNIRTTSSASYLRGESLTNEDKMIVVHHTGDLHASLSGVRNTFMAPGGNSAHVVIGFDGERNVYADPTQVTFHAGKSEFHGRKNVNNFGVGVEFQGDTNKKPLTQEQMESFYEYAAPIMKAHNMTVDDIVPHQKVRTDYMSDNPNDRNVTGKPDIAESEYQKLRTFISNKLAEQTPAKSPAPFAGGLMKRGGIIVTFIQK